ncbi:MAG: NAD(+) synthase [Treponema sp.]|nr:MAG: NAD(+) synthase [Treponema sp.]
MKNFGFVRCAVCSFVGQVANCDYNSQKIFEAVEYAQSVGVSVLLFPQLCLTGASCGDLFYQGVLLDGAKKALLEIAEKTSETDILFAVGLPLSFNNTIYSVLAVIQTGRILGFVPVKNNLSIFNFEVQGVYDVSALFGVNYSIPFGQMLFTEKSFTVSFGRDCIGDLVLLANCNPSFAGEGFNNSLKLSFKSEEKSCAILSVNSGVGESSEENVFSGECGIYSLGVELCKKDFLDLAMQGKDIFEKTSFVFSDVDVELIQNRRLSRHVSLPDLVTVNFSLELEDMFKSSEDLVFPVLKEPFAPNVVALTDPEKTLLEDRFYFDVINMQAFALAKRLKHIGCKKVLVGVSGGTDSTFALLSCALCFDILNISRKNIYAITMPCFGTTDGTKSNALGLASALGCSFEQINIENSVKSHFTDIGQDLDDYNTAFENAQARERTQVLMDRANQLGALVIGGSDLSEIALGWSTYGGDHLSMYNLNSSIPKTVLRKCIDYCKRNAGMFASEKINELSDVLSGVLATPISPELLPADKNEIAQKTEEILGSYELHDFFLYHAVVNGFSPDKICFLAESVFCKDGEYTSEEVRKAAELFFKRFFQNQFKRSTSPVGAAVLGVSLSSRSAWKMPGDVNSKLWLDFFQN